MSYVSEAYQGLANDMLRARENNEWQNALNQLQSNLNDAHRTIIAERHDIANALAQRAALAGFVRKLVDDPAVMIPLIDDNDLWERIGNAGVSAFIQTNDYGAAKTAGRTFSIPPVPDPFGKIYSKQKLTEQLTKEFDKKLAQELNEKVAAANKIINAGNENLINAEFKLATALAEIQSITVKLAQREQQMEKLQRDCVLHAAKSAVFRQQLLEAEPLNPMIADSAIPKRIAEAAYEKLVANKFTDWTVVKQFAASMSSDIRGAFGTPKM